MAAAAAPAPAPEYFEVALVGGGFAALAAAERLHAAGVPFVVLEARDRIGGAERGRRRLAGPLPRQGGKKPADMGCAWVHGHSDRKHPVAQLCAAAGVWEDDKRTWCCDARAGERVPAAAMDEAEGIYEKMGPKLRKAAKQARCGAVVPADPEDSLARGNASTLPFQFVVNKTQAAGPCYASGEAAAALERLSDPEAVAAAHRALSAAFPRAECPQPVAAAVSWLVDG
eukprot:TRINITY_DN16219_c0_g1_i5.p1 TRINITY_DN16219_c0_g1~~TRINITY_DN16219_c0_g1_i5.p1  ORF type:complete len:252 (+),score=62.84 TRINITY_DN16219_c0_g1_i5:75-758(+)